MLELWIRTRWKSERFLKIFFVKTVVEMYKYSGFECIKGWETRLFGFVLEFEYLEVEGGFHRRRLVEQRVFLLDAGLGGDFLRSLKLGEGLKRFGRERQI